jgi:hypothetical protein
MAACLFMYYPLLPPPPHPVALAESQSVRLWLPIHPVDTWRRTTIEILLFLLLIFIAKKHGTCFSFNFSPTKLSLFFLPPHLPIAECTRFISF